MVMCRFDFVRGYGGQFVNEYVLATEPHYVVGEYWDSLDYDGSVPRINQDRHRQQTIDWITAAGGAATAFDVTTKGILHAVFEVSACFLQSMHPACNTGNIHRCPPLHAACTHKRVCYKVYIMCHCTWQHCSKA